MSPALLPRVHFFGLALCLAASLAVTAAPSAHAASFMLPASDVGFVTEMGGSAKGDSTLAPGAKYNYSVGLELHYATGALGPVFAPMLRKNYFVFTLPTFPEPLATVKLKLWTGVLESADASELFVLKESTDVAGAAGLAALVASGTGTADYDSPGDALVMAADLLYDKLGDGPLLLAGAEITHAMDDSFIEIAFSPAGVAWLSGFAGGTVVLAGLVPSIAMASGVPQQPFGFTGPDVPGGGPMVPALLITTVPIPEPAAALLALLGLLGLALHAPMRCRAAVELQRRAAAQPG
jgi:hypothetical protein